MFFFKVEQEAFNTAFKSFQPIRLRQMSPTIKKKNSFDCRDAR